MPIILCIALRKWHKRGERMMGKGSERSGIFIDELFLGFGFPMEV
jgi:hypothetical protein